VLRQPDGQYQLLPARARVHDEPVEHHVHARGQTHPRRGHCGCSVDVSVDAAVHPAASAWPAPATTDFCPAIPGLTASVLPIPGDLFTTAVQVDIYASPLTDASPVLVKRCSLASNPSCTANGLAANTYHYVKVQGSTSGAVEYDISVTTGVSEGSVAAPVDLTLGAQPRCRGRRQL